MLCSVDLSQASHQRRHCAVAPSSESVTAPAIPPSAMAANAVGHLANAANAEMNSAPAMAAAVPAIVTPPDVPTGTGLSERMDTGAARDSVPISVARVSAADAARAPAPTAYQAGELHARCATAARTNSPPLATTCQASRSSPFSTIGPR